MIRRNSLEKINRINPDLGLFRVMTHHNTCLTSKPHAIIALIDTLALIWATGRLDVTPRFLSKISLEIGLEACSNSYACLKDYRRHALGVTSKRNVAQIDPSPPPSGIFASPSPH
jgi:hypothetical protein